MIVNKICMPSKPLSKLWHQIFYTLNMLETYKIKAIIINTGRQYESVINSYCGVYVCV